MYPYPQLQDIVRPMRYPIITNSTQHVQGHRGDLTRVFIAVP